MLKPLLTPTQVADLLHLSRRKVLSLDLPKVRVGDGRGKILFSEDDVRDYLRSRTEYPVTREQGHADRVPKKSQKMGLSVLPSREVLEAIRLGYSRGRQERGGGTKGAPS